MEIFLSEAVEASQCYFFEISFIKLKCPNLLNVLLAFFKLEGQFLLAILDFKVCHFELKHPVDEAASHGLASFEQASYIASSGSKIGYRLGLLLCQIQYICYYIQQ